MFVFRKSGEEKEVAKSKRGFGVGVNDGVCLGGDESSRILVVWEETFRKCERGGCGEGKRGAAQYV